jgi:hypothetical protein
MLCNRRRAGGRAAATKHNALQRSYNVQRGCNRYGLGSMPLLVLLGKLPWPFGGWHDTGGPYAVSGTPHCHGSYTVTWAGTQCDGTSSGMPCTASSRVAHVVALHDRVRPTW